MRRFFRLLLNSIVENERFSPRLLTAFAFSATGVAMLGKGIWTAKHISNGILIDGYPPEGILASLFGFLALLFGLGTYSKVQLEKPPAKTQVNTQTATVTAEGDVNVTAEKQQTLAGYNDGPGSTTIPVE